MDEDDLRRMLAGGADARPAEDRISERVRAEMVRAKRRELWLRMLASLLFALAVGVLLGGGYRLASGALPPIDALGVATLLWLPLGVVAGLVLIVAREGLLALIGRSR